MNNGREKEIVRVYEMGKVSSYNDGSLFMEVFCFSELSFRPISLVLQCGPYRAYHAEFPAHRITPQLIFFSHFPHLNLFLTKGFPSELRIH